MAKQQDTSYGVSRIKRRDSSVQGITPIGRIKKISALKTAESQQETDTESAPRPVPPSTIVNLSYVKSIQATPYGNVRRGGFMVGDENTLIRAAWACLGYAAKLAPTEQQQPKIKLLKELEALLQVSPNIVQILEQSFLQGRSGQVQPQLLGHKLQSWVGKESVLLDIIAELMVYMALEGQKMSSELINHVVQGVQPLNVSKVRLQHLMQLRQKELALGAYFKRPQGSFVAFKLPQKPTVQHKNKVLIEYALSILGLERPFTMTQVTATTQALVLHYAPEHLAQQHVPRPLIRLCSKKVAEAIVAYNLLRLI